MKTKAHTMQKGLHVVVGLGATGFSCVRFLKQSGIPVAVTDTRPAPPFLAAVQSAYPDVPVAPNGLDAGLLAQAEVIIVSPGISLQQPLLQQQAQRGIPLIGDIELFARAVQVPVIAITGTNAKSTVTTLVGLMAQAAGYAVQTGGNLGTPALDLFEAAPQPEVFVLELSSFQLETIDTLSPAVATILNITPDHMDRYADLSAYQAAKQRIYRHSKVAVCNRDDVLTHTHHHNTFYFTLGAPAKKEFGLKINGQGSVLMFEDQVLLPVGELLVSGKHYQANALAALAIGHSFGLPFAPMLKVLREFPGLPHRCQYIRTHNGVKWYNDSKGTNVGATQAAMEGLGSEMEGKLILIAGGIGKNADFTPLVSVMEKYVRHVVLIGDAALEMAKIIDKRVPVSFANSMQEAIAQAAENALQNDAVLLSPACASFDMFRNYEHRGEVFMEWVKKL